ncbi:integrase [Dyella solisilvae]|uniref:Integrase n=1 Tax=Dyella solisilvae TaxID=1920168 RepID=A0A370K3S6_9GAMM|nr:DNA-binding protein [Dyella solisilvae]RDI97323.1 integrase [Dyella solisilvae]
MARGITQDQVNRAADAILGAGDNPTVEKVRAELGTGSPNTITRMLDAWRRQLGERLRQLSALPEVPEAVGQAMLELWRLAADHAERVLESRVANERAALATAQAQLARERETWETRLQAAETAIAQAQTARELAEHACTTLDGQLQDSHALRADLVLQRDRLQDHCDQQAGLIQLLRAQLDDHQVALQSERERQEVHIRAVEDRSHQEVDRARQDAKQWQHRYEAAERGHRDVVTTIQNRCDSAIEQTRHLEQEASRHAGQVAALEKALSRAYSAATERKDRPTVSKALAKRGQAKKMPTRRQISKQRGDA